MKKIFQVLIPATTLIIGIFIGKGTNPNLKTGFENSVKRKNTLKYIESQPLIITYSDAECGEWGGNIEIIKVEKDGFKESLNAVYTYEKIDCSAPYSERSKLNITKSKKVKLSEEGENLVLAIILELIEIKLDRENIPSHSGVLNSVIIGDSTLIINDFPSEFIRSFGKLRNEILKE
ncbi:MAG: hypothetical protein R2798_03860 [Chitinophagales bacterium]|nr:hypothetical protein [Chitinophagales bacterium]